MASKFLKDIVKMTVEDLKQEASQIPALKEISANDVERVLRKSLDNILESLVQGDKVYLINSFNLEPKDYAEKKVKNPLTQEPMTIEPYRSILIKPSESAKERLREGKKKYPLK